MSFYGREQVLARAGEMIAVNNPHPNSQGLRDSPRSMLIAEGCGGSGRSELIAELERRWAAKAPTAKLDALTLKRLPGHESSPTAVSILLGSAMRQLTDRVPGYKISWGRISLLLLAMSKTISVTALDDGEQEMLSRMASISRDNSMLVKLFEKFMDVPLSVPVSVGAVTVDVGPLTKSATEVAKSAAEQVSKRMGRSARQPVQHWQPALSWFAPDGDWHAAISQLVRFSLIAGEVARERDPEADSERAMTQQSALRLHADSLLMNAFLSDLAESAAHLRGRPNNFVVLLDNADWTAGEEFLAAVATARREMFRWPAAADPLAVIAAGGKPRVLDQSALAGEGSMTGVEDRSDVVRLRLDGLSSSQVIKLRDEYPWDVTEIKPPPHVIAHLVYLLTGGHCLATRLVLRELQLDPKLASKLNQLLGMPVADRIAGGGEGDEVDAWQRPPSGVAQRVLHVIAAGLTPHGVAFAQLIHDLVTLSAARHCDEARRLRGRLLTDKVHREQLFSDVLWSHRTPDGRLAMIPVARHLLQRELAARPENSEVGWESLFNALSKKPGEPDGGTGLGGEGSGSHPPTPSPPSGPDAVTAPQAVIDRLHHQLALGQTAVVTEEMADLVDREAPWPEEKWLAWLDAATVTPVPARLTIAGLPANADGLRRNVFQLITALQQLADTCAHSQARLYQIYSKISSVYTNLTEYVPPDWYLIAKRAESYRVRANQIA